MRDYVTLRNTEQRFPNPGAFGDYHGVLETYPSGQHLARRVQIFSILKRWADDG